MQQNKKKPPVYKNDNIVESLTGIAQGVAKTSTSELGKIASEAVVAIFGGSTQKSGELSPNQVIEFGEQKQEIQQPRVETASRPNISQIQAETLQQINALRAELKAIASSLKNLNQEIHTAIAQAPVEAGVYHVTFFEQIRSMLLILRQQIEDSRTWLSMTQTRKKKMGYWGMFKKHGTSFGLSNERSLATAAG